MTKEQKILLLFVLAIVGAGGVYYVMQPTPTTKEVANVVSTETPGTATQETNTQTNTTQTGAISQKEAPVIVTQVVANKNIIEKLKYQVPEDHTEEITVTAVIDSTGTIVDVTFAYAPATNRESREYLAKFASAFKPALVVGQKISTAKASRVGGGISYYSSIQQGAQYYRN